jgi:hypothetical protein
MKTSLILAVSMIIAVSGAASAQTNQPKGPPDSVPTGNESSWQMMTETQVKDRLQREGYSDINIREDNSMPNKAWAGTARKDGRVLNIKIDSTGKVAEQ